MKNNFYLFNNANAICLPTHGIQIIYFSKYILLIPTALAAKSDLHIDVHEFEEKIT